MNGKLWDVTKVTCINRDDMVNREYYACSAPDTLFAPDYADVPEYLKEYVNEMGSLGCEGGGRPGAWCGSCYWAGTVDEYDVDFIEPHMGES